ncbi:MAG: formylmethanofuran dehydrogenase subunit A [Bacteroidia bacterium]|jgi:formylmethanofuran dehydrogenase subunit A
MQGTQCHGSASLAMARGVNPHLYSTSQSNAAGETVKEQQTTNRPSSKSSQLHANVSYEMVRKVSNALQEGYNWARFRLTAALTAIQNLEI